MFWLLWEIGETMEETESDQNQTLVWHQAITWPMLPDSQLDSLEQISMKFDGNFIIFIHENAFEMSSAKMAAILSGEGSMS